MNGLQIFKNATTRIVTSNTELVTIKEFGVFS
jgi:hypothetical protein